MGMSITDSLEWLVARKEHYEMDDDCQELAQALEVAIDTMRKYQLMQADYEARLKADLVAMLTEIQIEIHKKQECANTGNWNNDLFKGSYDYGLDTSCDIIQEKIDSLKEKSEDKE